MSLLVTSPSQGLYKAIHYKVLRAADGDLERHARFPESVLNVVDHPEKIGALPVQHPRDPSRFPHASVSKSSANARARLI